MSELINRGIIYIITNKINEKYYVGQTKEYSGITDIRKYGLHVRWREHVSAAKRNKVNGCTLLNKAIREHGEESFNVEVLFYCDLEDRDEIEIATIYLLDSNNPLHGYNVCSGGNSVSGFPITQDSREKTSKTLVNPSGFCNIKQIKSRTDKTIVIGYKVSRDEKGIRYNKDFSDSKFTLEQNLELAKVWLEELKKGNHIDNKHKKPDDLPLYVRYHHDQISKKLCGYKFEIRANGESISKCFSKKSMTMEVKLDLAIKYKDEILENLRKNQQSSSKDE